ncbi:uncharacterized protein LOC123684626 [Harmonia axyridis]|uniref:uncharacterized protein LOC123684626 n=1 Tax=Harmonia axyridis TaxID=115357 RepID=UPI001E27983A|nr:uncharacterized protein LOC123684626 [Harmonia axyridis]
MTGLKLVMCFLCTLLQVQCRGKISKRSLFFPTTTVLQFTYGLSVPLTIDGAEGGTTILLSACLQGNYDLPKKATDLQVHDLTKREAIHNEDLSKIEIYYYILDYLRSLDLNGEECLARMVCEIAKYPLDFEKEDNVLEKIAHFLLTPSHGNFEDMDADDSTFHSKLLTAEKDGRRKEPCERKYKLCEVSLASLFTTYFID